MRQDAKKPERLNLNAFSVSILFSVINSTSWPGTNVGFTGLHFFQMQAKILLPTYNTIQLLFKNRSCVSILVVLSLYTCFLSENLAFIYPTLDGTLRITLSGFLWGFGETGFFKLLCCSSDTSTTRYLRDYYPSISRYRQVLLFSFCQEIGIINKMCVCYITLRSH